MLLLHLAAQAQPGTQRYTLKGRVTDAAGQGLPGANVLLNGTTAGTAAGADGDYIAGRRALRRAPTRSLFR